METFYWLFLMWFLHARLCAHGKASDLGAGTEHTADYTPLISFLIVESKPNSMFY